MYDEFEKLLRSLEELKEQKNPDMNEVLNKTHQFFIYLKEEIVKASPEKRQEMMIIIQEMQAKLNQEVQEVMKKAGISSQEMAAYSQDPKYFTKEQREKFTEAEKEVEETKQALLGDDATKKSKNPLSKSKKSKKDKWMKS